MQLWQDGFVAVLAAIGVVNLLWGLAQFLLALKKTATKQALAVIAATGDAGDVQEQVRALTGLGQNQGLIDEFWWWTAVWTRRGKALPHSGAGKPLGDPLPHGGNSKLSDGHYIKARTQYALHH